MSTYSDLKSAAGGSATTVYAALADLPLSDVATGAQAYVGATNRLYLWNGTGWYNIALINTAPTITTGGDAAYALAPDGSATVVTLEANDPEGIPIVWSYAVTTGSLGSTATVTQADNVFTITPSIDSADAGEFSLTFTASDGVNLATSASAFTLAFEPSWAFPVEQQILQHTWAGFGSIANDYFGCSAALSNDGNLAVVGAWGEDNPVIRAGAAYIFTRSGGVWTELEELKADAGSFTVSSYARFGNGVDMSGDGNTVIAGAYDQDTTVSGSGAAYIFTRSGDIWTQQAMLIASNPLSNGYFGYRTAISDDGNTVVMAADVLNIGHAYVFTRSGSTWTQQAKILNPSSEALSYFGKQGVSISGDGNTIGIGAHYYDGSIGTSTGAAYIFTRSGSTWALQHELVASDAAAYHHFGSGVALSYDGNTVIVGSEGSKYSGYAENERSAGAAYIFTRAGSTWTEEARIQASDAGHFYDFGGAVDMSSDGTTVIVGDPDNNTGGPNAGAAYIFTKEGSTWTEQSMIQASDIVERQTDGNDLEFGTALALSGDGYTAIVGAQSSDLGTTGADRGAAYIFAAG